MNIAHRGVHILDWAMGLNGDEPPVGVMGLAGGADRKDQGHLPPESTSARVVFANGPMARRVWSDEWNAILGVWASALDRRVVELAFDAPEDLTERGIAVFEGRRGAA